MSQEVLGNEEKASYRTILKSTSLFGGVQGYQILIDIIRSKIIAVLLGPEGIGIQGLYTSATQFIYNLTSFGLSTSAVRDVAKAYAEGETEKIGKTVSTLNRLVWITGLLGTLVVVVFSSVLSNISFGDNAHYLPFIIISVTLLLDQLSAGKRAILQGTRRLKSLALSSAIGVTIGLLVASPLYYWFGTDGIVPNIIITSLTTLCLSRYFAKKVIVKKVSLSNSEMLSIGKSMLVMGVAMSISHILSFASSYALRACIRLWGGVEAVGLFSAGYILMNQYTGLVFKAMGTDYYPRLASINQDNARCGQMINQQGIIGVLLLAPLLLICMVFIPFIINILFSNKFCGIEDYVVWCSVGMLFKMASWAISYIFVAKGESKLFIIIESTAAIYTLALNVLGYKLLGLTGLGISFTISYILYLLQVYCIASKRYHIRFDNAFFLIFAVQMIIIIIAIISIHLINNWWRYLLGICLILLSVAVSYKELNKRLDIRSYVVSKLKKMKK